jgi:hypothetical protein
VVDVGASFSNGDVVEDAPCVREATEHEPDEPLAVRALPPSAFLRALTQEKRPHDAERIGSAKRARLLGSARTRLAPDKVSRISTK